MRRTKVIAGFPGVGKSYCYQTNLGKRKMSDSDSSAFSWIIDEGGNKVRNPKFVEQYMDHIQSLIDDEYDVVFVSTHRDVLQGLLERGIEFTIVRPNTQLKEEYLERYKTRGSDESFIKLMDTNWDSFMKDLESFEERVPHIALSKGTTMDWALFLIEDRPFEGL